MRKNATKLLLSTLAAGLLTASAANAAPVTFYDGTYTGYKVDDPLTVVDESAIVEREANVKFQQDGNLLLITLTNTFNGDTLVPTDILTAVFFSLSGDPAPVLTRVSAVLNTGSTVIYDADGQPAGGVVGGEWAYRTNLPTVLSANAPQGADSGISSTGLGVFGPTDVFPGPNLAGPVEPDGPQYGLVSAGDDATTGNTGVKGNAANPGGQIDNSVIFTLSGLDATKTYTVADVWFQWGTDLGEPNETCCTSSGGIPGSGDVPEPGTLSLFGGALLLGSLTYARRRKARARV